MAEYFVGFARNMIYFVISVEEVSMVPFRNKGFIPWGWRLRLFYALVKIWEISRIMASLCRWALFLSKSNKDFVDRNLLLPFVTRKLPVSNSNSRIWIYHISGLDVFSLWIIIRKSIWEKETGSYLDYSLFVPKLFQKSMVHLWNGEAVFYWVWLPNLSNVFGKSWERKWPSIVWESDGITELCSGPGYMRNKYPLHFEDNLFLPFEETEMPIWLWCLSQHCF